MTSRNIGLSRKSELSVLTPDGGTFSISAPSDKVKKQRGGRGPSCFYSVLEHAIRAVLIYDEEGTIEEIVAKVHHDLLETKEEK